jgi:hypothetical protein
MVGLPFQFFFLPNQIRENFNHLFFLGVITRRGVIGPMTEDVNNPLMKALEAEGIHMVEEVL